MKKRNILSMLLAVILLSIQLFACSQSEQDKLYDELTQKTSSDMDASSETIAANTQEPTPYVDPDGLEGEFTVMAFQDSSQMENQDTAAALVKEFMELHPGVTVNVEYATGKEVMTPQERKEQYKTRILTELGSGEADYLLFSPREEMNLYGLSKSGIFLDLRPYFESDPSINPDDYYTQVLDAMAMDGKLTVMPYSFSLEGGFLNRRLMEKMEVDLEGIKAVDYEMILDWYDQAR